MKTILNISFSPSILVILLASIMLMSGCNIQKNRLEKDIKAMNIIMSAVDAVHNTDYPLLLKEDSLNTELAKRAEHYHESIHREKNYWESITREDNYTNPSQLDSYNRFINYSIAYVALFPHSPSVNTLRTALGLDTKEEAVPPKDIKWWEKEKKSLDAKAVEYKLNAFRLAGEEIYDGLYNDMYAKLRTPESSLNVKMLKLYSNMNEKIAICLAETQSYSGRWLERRALKRKFNDALEAIRLFNKELPSPTLHPSVTENIKNFNAFTIFWDTRKVVIVR